MSKRHALAVISFLSCLLMSACAAPQKSAIFYPPAPDAPRIQYLVSYSCEKDLKKGAFSRLLAEQTGELGFAMQRARSVAFWGSKMYVADSRLRGVSLFDLEAETGGLLSAPSEVLIKPMEIAIDARGTKFVTDPDDHKIVAIDADEKVIQYYRQPAGFRPLGIAVDEHFLYVTEVRPSRLYVIDKQSGAVLKTLEEQDGVRWPAAVAVAPGGGFYVTNLAAFNVVQFDDAGRKLREIGKIGDYAGSFSRPKGIEVDREGRIYVLDTAFENVQIFNPQGELLMFFGKTGTKPENLVAPASLTIDYQSVDFFQRFAAPGFKLEYVIAVSNQAGPSRVNVYGFGHMAGVDYGRYE